VIAYSIASFPNNRALYRRGGVLGGFKIQRICLEQSLDKFPLWVSRCRLSGFALKTLTPVDTVRVEGFTNGAARFSRGEECNALAMAKCFTCTNGGNAERGQVWRYISRKSDRRWHELELFVEPNEQSVLETPITSPYLATATYSMTMRDGDGTNHIVGGCPKANSTVHISQRILILQG